MDDAAGAAALVRTVYPERLSTEAGQRHRMTTAPARAYACSFKVERDGTIVGWASGMLDWLSTTPADAYAGLLVHPAHRSAGIGSGLWLALQEHLATIGAETIRTQGDGESSTARFAERWGFRRTSTETALVLDPRAASAPDELPPGVVVLPISSRAHQRDAIFEVDRATMQDEPGDHDFGGLDYEAWERETFAHPDFDPDLSTLVEVDGILVGTSLLFVDRDSGRALNGGTGILREHRGRGLGLMLKRHALAAAARAGIDSVFTVNDETNAPMLAINRRLGYRPFAERTAWRRG